MMPVPRAKPVIITSTPADTVSKALTLANAARAETRARNTTMYPFIKTSRAGSTA
jgi:hypothetical protein